MRWAFSNPTKATTVTVGASLLAKNVNDNASSLTPRGARKFFASKLAPTLAACISQIRGSRQASSHI
ncbi:hypothetical protein CRN80_12625 [Pseudomonas sp. FDAARGOS_380]|nr:hypothetical protein CRN80_12625 [Pseudomonas sp. FDAARGOS_380]